MEKEKYIGILRNHWGKAAVTATLCGLSAVAFHLFDYDKKPENSKPEETTPQKQVLEEKVNKGLSGQLGELGKAKKELGEQHHEKWLEQYHGELKKRELEVNQNRLDVKLMRKQIDGLEKTNAQNLGDLAESQQKYTNVMDDYTFALKQKESLEIELKEMNNQLEGVSVNLKEIRRQYDLSLKDINRLEKDKSQILEQVNETLTNYTQLLESVKRDRSLVGTAENQLEKEVLKWKNVGIDIVFLKGDLKKVDKKTKDVYEGGNYDITQIRERLITNAGVDRAFLMDFNKDGINDLVYEGDEIGTDKLKLGRENGTFSRAKAISNDLYRKALSSQVLEVYGLDN